MSVAVQTTVLVPTGKSDPDAGSQTTDTSPQLSVAAGGSNSTIALPSPAAAATKISLGQVISGGSDSVTVTVKEQLAVPLALLTVQSTLETPTGNVCGDVMRTSPILQRRVGMGFPDAMTENATE